MTHRYRGWSQAFVASLVVGLGSLSCAPSGAEDDAAAAREASSAAPGHCTEKRFKFFTQLLTSNEVPPLPSDDPEAGVFGVDELALRVEGDTATARLKFTLCGITTDTITFRAVDVHKGPAGTRGKVVINTAVSDNNPLTLDVDDGCVSASLEGIAPLSTDLAKDIIAHPLSYYGELHETPHHPNGLVRGQFQPPVPLPDDP